LFTQRAHGLSVSPALGAGYGIFHFLVRWISDTSLPSVIFRKQDCFDKLVQFIQVDIAEYWTTHSALRCSAQRLMPAPFFEVSCLEHVSDQHQKSVIVDAFSQDVHENLMVQTAETIGYVALNIPMHALPGLHNFAECCVAAAPWAKPVRMLAKARLKVGVEQVTHHLLQHFRRPAW
jgi:hypothetical protein